MTRIALLLTFLALVSGCDSRSSPEYLLNEYAARVSRVTEQPIPNSTPPLTLPPLRERQHSIPDIRVTALSALDLLQCPALSQKIAWRNSSLGKQMPPSKLLHYEKQLLNELSNCLEYLKEQQKDPETQQQLRTLLQQKREALPNVRWNLLFAETELARQLRNPPHLLPTTGDNGRQGTLTALNFMGHYILDQTLAAPYDSEQLELHLQQISASRYSGQLLASVQALTQTLNQVASMLNQAEIQCKNTLQVTQAERLNNVFHQFYADGLQPYLARVIKAGEEWRLTLLQLIQQLPPAPDPAMQSYLHAVTSAHASDSLWEQLDQAIQRHTHSWQTLLSQCNLMPSR